MKKILSTTLLVTAMAVAFTGCLKDKGFENYTYGINDPDTQPPGVGFPFGSNAKNDYGLDVTASPQLVNGLVYVNLEAGNPASSAVNITISNNTTALVNAYNAANGTAIQALPTAIWSVPTTLTIASGGRNTQAPITVTNTTALNSNLQYAVGLTITAVSGGYKIADNLKNLLIVFSVKNKYDGKYTMRGQFYHPSLQPDFGPHVFSVELHTSGPNSVRLYWPLVGGYNTPLTSGGGPACCFASQELSLNVNPATDAATPVNTSPGGLTYDPITTHNGNVYNNRWNDPTKVFYAAWGYFLGAGGTVGAGSRAWIDTLTRTGPR